MNLESPKINVSKSPQEIFDFLSDIKNFESLMPDNISKFEVLSDDTFLFA
jgi:carbon monoxide dehydrogenase subunit G